MSSPRVSIIILNWNGWKDTIECLDSLYRINYYNYEIVLIDNGSDNDSVRRIRSYCEGNERVESSFLRNVNSGKPIEILEYAQDQTEIGGDPDRVSDFERIKTLRKLKLVLNKKNLGFAEGSNVGIRYALASSKPEFVLLLNNDTVVHPDFLTHLVESATWDKSVGIAGPKVYFYEKKGRRDVICSAGCRVDMRIGRPELLGWEKIDVGEYDHERYVDYGDGSCLLTRSEMIRNIGILNPAFFMYWEETDWCFRTRHAGYNTVYVPKAVIWHKCTASRKGRTPQFYMTRNHFGFMKKHATKTQYCAFLAYFVTATCLHLMGMMLKGYFDELPALARGTIDGLGFRSVVRLDTSL